MNYRTKQGLARYRAMWRLAKSQIAKDWIEEKVKEIKTAGEKKVEDMSTKETEEVFR